jgi:glutaconyl-CoA decarboxylase
VSTLLQGFNVTIYGMGLVFMALLVLMVATMLLAKLLSATTGTEFSVASSPEAREGSPSGAAALTPTSVGQAAPSPPVASAAAQPITLTLNVGGRQHRAEVVVGNGAPTTVRLGGSSYEIQRDPADRKRILVNGQAHTVEVQESSASSATVLVDGSLQKVEIAREVAPAAAPAAPASPAPAAAPPRAPSAAGERVIAPLPGKVLSIVVKAGDRVNQGDELCVIEAMKMANSIKAPRGGVVAEVVVSPGQTVPYGAALIILN